jgi:hypothetical protein
MSSLIGNPTKNSHRGIEYKIEIEEYPENPREWDSLGTMICVHRRYKLGDKQVASAQYNSWEHMRDELEKEYAVVVPLYLYDHSGITMNTTGFSCPWDSGQVGYIVVSRETILKEYSDWKVLTQKRKKEIMKRLVGEVETYDQYLRGEIYQCSIEKIDISCGNFYSEESAREWAADEIDYYLDNQK